MIAQWTGLGVALTAAAAGVGSLHSLAPDHWVPITAVARARRWSIARATRIAALCGFGHVTVSALLALVALLAGREALETFANRLGAVAGIALVTFGLVYGAWGLRRTAGHHIHGHTHAHYDHVHDPGRMSVWSLFLIYSADPCVALIPLVVAAAPLGTAGIVTVIVVYELATIGTMVALVLLAASGTRAVRLPWLDRYGDVAAGALIAATGLAMIALE